MEPNMSDHIVSLYEAKTHLSRLVDQAARGEPVIISKHGKPLARLVAFGEAPIRRQPGCWEGRVVIRDDFDDPLPDELLRAFSGDTSGDTDDA
jgi:prevent-host-death family protein